MNNQATVLRKTMEEKEFIYTAGAYDALSGMMIENAGFDAVFTSGYAISASYLGMPDAELYTMTENLQVVQNIVNAVGIPVICDADTGYGNALNVIRTVKSFERAGVAGIILEDQIVPKRCPLGVSNDPELISIEEGAAKIQAAVEAKSNEDFIIIARTDAFGEDAIERANAYISAGADFIQPLSYVFGDVEGLVKFGQSVSVPLSLQMTKFAHDGISENMLRKINGKFIHFPLVPLMLASAALEDGLRQLVKHKKTKDLKIENRVMMDTDEFKNLIGFDEIERLQEKYMPINKS